MPKLAWRSLRTTTTSPEWTDCLTSKSSLTVSEWTVISFDTRWVVIEVTIVVLVWGYESSWWSSLVSRRNSRLVDGLFDGLLGDILHSGCRHSRFSSLFFVHHGSRVSLAEFFVVWMLQIEWKVVVNECLVLSKTSKIVDENRWESSFKSIEGSTVFLDKYFARVSWLWLCWSNQLDDCYTLITDILTYFQIFADISESTGSLRVARPLRLTDRKFFLLLSSLLLLREEDRCFPLLFSFTKGSHSRSLFNSLIVTVWQLVFRSLWNSLRDRSLHERNGETVTPKTHCAFRLRNHDETSETQV